MKTLTKLALLITALSFSSAKADDTKVSSDAYKLAVKMTADAMLIQAKAIASLQEPTKVFNEKAADHKKATEHVTAIQESKKALAEDAMKA